METCRRLLVLLLATLAGYGAAQQYVLTPPYFNIAENR
jgi:hypothetical protein